MRPGIVLYGRGDKRFVEVYDAPWNNVRPFVDALTEASPGLNRNYVAPLVSRRGHGTFVVLTSEHGVERENLQLVGAVFEAARKTGSITERINDFFSF